VPFEVSEAGDLAKWATEDPTFPPSVGGAMDLAVGAKEVCVLMDHVGKNGDPRIRHRSPCPSRHLVSSSEFTQIWRYVQPRGLLVGEMVAGITSAEFQSLTEPKLQLATNLQILAPPGRP
jgi:3-oxoadipate CoA-transferase, beta subunit